jgi:hypothetical protein
MTLFGFVIPIHLIPDTNDFPYTLSLIGRQLKVKGYSTGVNLLVKRYRQEH